MSNVSEPGATSVDGEAAARAAQEATDARLLAAATFTQDDLDVVYVSDALLERYGSRENLESALERVHQYVRLDFIERDLFDDLDPDAGAPKAISTHTDEVSVVRILAPDCGLYCSFEPGADIAAVVQAVEPVLAEWSS